MADWNYGDAYKRHPCEKGTVVFADGSRVKCHDIMRPLPRFMYDADLIFTDSPWNTGNLRSFYTKAAIPPKTDFPAFMARLFRCVGDISSKTCYLEIGKDFLADYVTRMRRIYPYVAMYNSSYYHRPDNFCYIVRGSKAAKKPRLDNMDEEDIIAWVCAHEDFTCVGDLCMGRGLVGAYANQNGKRFVGTELNHRRLSVLIERLANAGLQYQIVSEVSQVNRTDSAKTNTLQLRLSEDEKERWRKAAAEEGMSLSVYVRHIVNNELKRRTISET